MALNYKLEYFKDEEADEGVYIHLRINPPVYQSLISKEEYLGGGGNNVSGTGFLDGIFAIPGVVRVASQAWRVYVEKSPIFSWNIILEELLPFIAEELDETEINELPGSGITLSSKFDRRSPL